MFFPSLNNFHTSKVAIVMIVEPHVTFVILYIFLGSRPIQHIQCVGQNDVSNRIPLTYHYTSDSILIY